MWPPTSVFTDRAAFIEGIARMADAAGVDHMGIGSDMLGLLTPSVFSGYEQLPHFAASLLRRRLLGRGRGVVRLTPPSSLR